MILDGIKGLLASRKGTAFLLTLLVSSAGLLSGKLGGAPFASVVGIIFGVFTASHAYQQVNGSTSIETVVNNVRNSIKGPDA